MPQNLCFFVPNQRAARPGVVSCVLTGSILAWGRGKSRNGRKKISAKKSKVRNEEPLGTQSYRTSSKRSESFWLLIGATKPLFFCAQSESSKTRSRFVCSYTDWYKKASCSPCLFLLEEKNSNHRTRCRANRAAYPQKASPEIRWIFAGIVRVA